MIFDPHQLTLLVIGCIFTVSIVRPYIFIAAIPLAVIFVVIRKYFLRTGQQLKQLEAEGESREFKPVLHTFSFSFSFTDNLNSLYQTAEY